MGERMVGRMIPRRLGMTRLAWVDFPVEIDWAADSSSLKGNSTDSEWQGYRGGWSVEGFGFVPIPIRSGFHGVR